MREGLYYIYTPASVPSASVVRVKPLSSSQPSSFWSVDPPNLPAPPGSTNTISRKKKTCPLCWGDNAVQDLPPSSVPYRISISCPFPPQENRDPETLHVFRYPLRRYSTVPLPAYPGCAHLFLLLLHVLSLSLNNLSLHAPAQEAGPLQPFLLGFFSSSSWRLFYEFEHSLGLRWQSKDRKFNRNSPKLPGPLISKRKNFFLLRIKTWPFPLG